MSDYPRKLVKGSFRVNITRNTQTGQFRVQYSTNGESVQFVRNIEAEALELAATKLQELYAGGLRSSITVESKADYLECMKDLDDSGLREPVAPHLKEYLTQFERIKEHNGTIAEAVTQWIRTHSTTESKPVREAAQEFLNSKNSLTIPYQTTLKMALTRFIRGSIAENVEDISPIDLSAIDLKGLGPKSRNHVKHGMRTFLTYCRSRRWLSKDFEFITLLAPERLARGKVGILSPEEFTRFITFLPEAMIAPFAVACFAGIRIAEIQRLDWKDFSFERQSITIPAEQAKTNRRRIVPMTPNLNKWLEPYRKKSGPFTEYASLSSRLYTLSRRAGITWKKNAPRHSYISYRLELVKSADQVSLEAGNSPQEIFEHYRELVTKEAAETWFSIVPSAAGNVVEMVS